MMILNTWHISEKNSYKNATKFKPLYIQGYLLFLFSCLLVFTVGTTTVKAQSIEQDSITINGHILDEKNDTARFVIVTLLQFNVPIMSMRTFLNGHYRFTIDQRTMKLWNLKLRFYADGFKPQTLKLSSKNITEDHVTKLAISNIKDDEW